MIVTSAMVFIISVDFYTSIIFSQNDSKGLYVIDVGQGDALLYVTKEDQTLLIDTGRPGDGIVEKLKTILGKYKKKIDIIVLTHPDSDHVGEIDSILKSYNVGLVLYSPIYDVRIDSKNSIGEIISVVKKMNGLTLPIFAGSNIKFSQNESVYFLSPSYSGMVDLTNKKDISEDNYFSVVSLIKNKDIIFAMADAPQKVERIISSSLKEVSVFDQIRNLTSEKLDRISFEKVILKVGHHGSKTSSSPDFIQKVFPTDAVLSYGKNNRYSHPNQETLDTLSVIPKIKIHRTIFGTVYFNE